MSSSRHDDHEQKKNQWIVLILVVLILIAILAMQIETYRKVSNIHEILLLKN